MWHVMNFSEKGEYTHTATFYKDTECKGEVVKADVYAGKYSIGALVAGTKDTYEIDIEWKAPGSNYSDYKYSLFRATKDELYMGKEDYDHDARSPEARPVKIENYPRTRM